MAELSKRVGLLGAGYIAKWHAEALRRQRGVEISAVCDLSTDAAKSLADAYGAPQVFASLDEMLAANAVDCVHVLTPPQTHFSAASKILEVGLAAFVEKPCAISSADCRMLVRLADAHGARLGVNHNFLMLPSYDKLKADIESDVLGPIDTLEVNWQFPLAPLRSGPFGLWMLREPGNLLFEVGPHLYAFVTDLLGEFTTIEVRLRNPISLPGGVTHYQTWQIVGEGAGAGITLNLSLVEGCDNRSVRLRGLGGVAVYDFAQDTYQLQTPKMQDIVIGPLAAQLSVAGQALKTGLANAARQVASVNRLAPYGLSISNAVSRFYSDWEKSAPVDPRLSIDQAIQSTEMIEAALAIAKSQFATSRPISRTAAAAPQNGETVLIIGGTGFIGRALTSALADRGYAVRIFSRGAGAGFDRPDGRVSVFTGSLKSSDDLAEAMQGVSAVFHLARATESSWQGYVENDVNVTKLIGEACLRANVRRLVYTGTIDSYDASRPERPITEETPFDDGLEQRNLYARSKAACEEALKSLEREQNLPLVIVRPGIVIGKGGPLQHWGIAMWRGATACKLWGGGKNTLPFVLVDDVADGLVQSLETPEIEGRSFNLIGDPMLSALDYFDAVSDANGVKVRAVATPIWTYFTVDVVKYWAKRLLAKQIGLTKPSFRDWMSRAQLSPYENQTAKDVLGWRPESVRERFIQRGIVDACLFGIDGGQGRYLSSASEDHRGSAQVEKKKSEALVKSA